MKKTASILLITAVSFCFIQYTHAGYTSEDNGPHVLTLFWETSPDNYCVKKVIKGYDHKHSCDSAGYVACDVGEYDEFECDKEGDHEKWVEEWGMCQ